LRDAAAGVDLVGLVPGIHVFAHLSNKTWMARMSPAMTTTTLES
jgi:hypothetical protein